MITFSDNIGYLISTGIVVVLAIIASISDIANDSMSLASALTFLYIINQFVIDNFMRESCKGDNILFIPIVGTVSIFLLTWIAISFFNIHLVKKIKKDKTKTK